MIELLPSERDVSPREGARRTVGVVGAGAAGLMAAIAAAEEGASVTLLDKNERAGRKLGITGKGRCNLTNACPPDEFASHILRGARPLTPALARFSPRDTMAYFEQTLGLPLVIERGERVFPASGKAGDVVRALVRRAHALGVRFLRETVVDLTVGPAGEVTGVRTAGGDLPFDRTILCTGGMSYPATGSTGDGLRLAARLGLAITPMTPSLVPLVAAGEDARDCLAMQGLSLRNVELRLLLGGKTLYRARGEMLFTHFGVSGPLVLTASAHLPQDFARGGGEGERAKEKDSAHSRAEENGARGSGSERAFAPARDDEGSESVRALIDIDLKPALDEATLDRRLLSDFAAASNRDFRHALDRLLPAKMIPVVVRRSGIPPTRKVHSVTREERARLLRTLKHFTIEISGTRPIEEAIISRGGVDLRDLNTHTMEARRRPGLYLAGELLDADATTGGFNLQIAFSTGRLAGKCAAGAMK